MAYPVRRGPYQFSVPAGVSAHRRKLLTLAAALIALAIALQAYAGLIRGRTPAPAVLTDDAIGAALLPAATPAPAAMRQVTASAPPPTWDGVTPPNVSSEAVAIIDFDSGALLLGKDPHRRLPPASITKIVAAMVALDRGNLDELITGDFDGGEYSLKTDSTVMGLRPGEPRTLRDLLYGLLLPSGNDAAIVIARHFAGSEAAFAELMNAKARELGLINSNFRNPHGLHERDHYSSAYDMARLGQVAMSDPRFREIVSARRWDLRGDRPYTIHNKNDFLLHYQGAEGIKIGWTEEAGGTFVGSATRDGHRLIIVLLDTDRRVTDATKLLDWAFAHFEWR